MSLRDLLVGSAPTVAPLLLGMRLENRRDGTSIIITEAEAYTEDDPASHSRRGQTARNRSMFGDPGTLYVYRSYGVHWCANVTTGPTGVGEAVLVRAGRPERGIEIMEKRRGRTDRLTDGPGKVCAALAITGTDDGSDLVAGPIRLSRALSFSFGATPRIGISAGRDRRWRFVATFDQDSLPSDTDET